MGLCAGGCRLFERRQVAAYEVPVPGFAPDASTWILERFELQSVGGKANCATVGEKKVSVRRDQMRHGMTLPAMTVQPEATVHREDHPITAMREFSVSWRGAVVHAPRFATDSC